MGTRDSNPAEPLQLRAPAVVTALPIEAMATLIARPRAGQRVFIYGALIYSDSGVAYLAVDADGTTLLVSSNACAVTWPAPPPAPLLPAGPRPDPTLAVP